ncbi:MAG TPA: phosphoglycerate kinase, partial [Candidatus Babeliales bacterium]|nr:phosphoglycerate kinase [Candidatus Babeliales bacterium]
MTFDYENIKSKISSWNLKHQRVFLRADLNVPLENDQISDDLRLKRILLTLDMLLEKDATIILATHLGRPKNQERNLSTKIIAQWLQDRGYPIHFEPNLERVNQVTISKHRQKGIILLENLRFFEGEKSKDHEFAKILRSLADFYINDAFGTAHRSDTSLTLLPQL